MGAVDDALMRSKAQREVIYNTVQSIQSKGMIDVEKLMTPASGLSFLDQFQGSGQNRQRYAFFRGWVHSAINALASEAAGQPAQAGEMKVAKKPKNKPGQKPKKTKMAEMGTEWISKNLPKSLQSKAASNELEVLADHEIITTLERPNSIQHRWQFVYSYIANLCLTGYSFVVCGENEETKQMEFFSIPTTWIVPNHQQGPFTRFRIINPENPTSMVYADDEWFDRTQVGFSYIPDPSNPLKALSLTQAQEMGIRIDDHIQSSQNVFFENGVFPSVVVTVGSQPHPDVPGGLRPRLSAAQRRQVYAAIKKVSGGVANYGNPAIVDGLIEKIERLSATQNEMGWEKSEQAVRTRILSAFSVHPFILGEQMAGSYAQAYIVQEVFCKRVNTYLEMLGWLITALYRQNKDDDGLVIWWTPAKPRDPQMEQQLWAAARQRGDVTQNEFRAWMDLPPDADSNEEFIDKTALPQVLQIAGQSNQGAITTDQAVAILEGLGLPTPLAVKIAGNGPPEGAPPPGTPPGGFMTDADGYPLPPEPIDGEADTEDETVAKAISALDRAVKSLECDTRFLEQL